MHPTTNVILKRVEEGIATGDDLFVDLMDSTPEICRPHHSGIDGELNRGCWARKMKIGKLALMVETGDISVEEALKETEETKTCRSCINELFA